MYISSGHWSLSLDLDGGRIQELCHKGTKVFGTYNRIDGKQGNTHVCIPSFDREGQEKYGLPFHGLVRNIKWQVNSQSKSSLSISCKTPSSTLYLAQLSVEQQFNLEDSFIHRIRITHIKGKEVPVNIGCHYYWDTPRGWNKIKIQNINQEEVIETNGYIDLQEKNSIDFPHAKYELISYGFHSAVLWTSFKIDENKNKVYSNDFCCIEPIIGWPHYFGSKQSFLRLGETVSASIQLKKVV